MSTNSPLHSKIHQYILLPAIIQKQKLSLFTRSLIPRLIQSYRTRKNDERNSWDGFKRNTRPQSPPTEQRRNLSISDEEGGLVKHRYRKKQKEKCYLLNMLPREIRTIIWELVVGGYTIHVYQERDRLRHGITGITSYSWLVGRRYNEVSHGSYLRGDSLTQLWLTSHQIYRESIDIVYNSNCFIMGNKNYTLSDLQRTILPQRLQQIRRLVLHWNFNPLDLDYQSSRGLSSEIKGYPEVTDLSSAGTWENACVILKEMAGLRELWVVTPKIASHIDLHSQGIVLERLNDFRVHERSLWDPVITTVGPQPGNDAL